MQIVLQKQNRKWLSLFLLLCSLAFLFSCYFQLCRVPTKATTFISFPSARIDLPVMNEGEFSVITYNIAGLPEVISSAITERASSIQEIGRRVNQFDIVHVQEDFNYNDYLYKQNEHPYKTKSKGGVPFGDGLSTLSRFPIIEMQRIPWNQCTGADCLTPKGFSYSKIEVSKGVYIDFYNVHANAEDDADAAAARRRNMEQLSAYIQQHSKHQAVIIMGDLNARYCYSHDNVRKLLFENGLKDAWITLKGKDIMPSIRDYLKEDILSLNDECESIDKILYRNSDKLVLQPKDYRFENIKFNNGLGLPLSDHCPVSLSFNWQIVY
jgi:endonuclease/exonuclease/phosphatase family metal-dependent hydrolase